MKISRTLITILLLVSFVAGQKAKDDKPNFDVADFNKKFEVAEWLVEYDYVAWKSTDIVTAQPESELARLGEEWFCFQDPKNVWHAVYGKLTGDKYDAVFHFETDAAGKIVKSAAGIDADFALRHARALKTGRDKLKQTIPASSTSFNQYIRQNPDKTISVWLLPAFQRNGVAAYGGEAIYLIDAAGTKILKDESYFQKNFRGFQTKPPRDIELDYIETEKPTLGAIFFVWYYKAYFTQILINNSKSASTVIKIGDNYIWTHVEKDKPANKPK